MKNGILALQHLSREQRDAFIQYMSSKKVNREYLEFLELILGESFLKFIDLYSGETIKVPTREESMKAIQYINIYFYLKNRGFTEESYDNCSKIFQKRKSALVHIVEKVEKALTREVE